MLDFSSWVAKVRGRCSQHCLAMKRTKGFFAKEGMLAGMDIGEVMLLSWDEVEEFVFVVGRIEEESVEVESQDEEGWVFSDESFLSL